MIIATEPRKNLEEAFSKESIPGELKTDNVNHLPAENLLSLPTDGDSDTIALLDFSLSVIVSFIERFLKTVKKALAKARHSHVPFQTSLLQVISTFNGPRLPSHTKT